MQSAPKARQPMMDAMDAEKDQEERT